MTSTKTFDCIEFKRRSQERIHRSIRNLTPEQEVMFFRREVEDGPFAKLWASIRRSSGQTRRHRPPEKAATGRRRVGG